MLIRIRSEGRTLNAEVLDFIHERARDRLGDISSRVQAVFITLGEHPGRKPTDDHRCGVQLTMPGRPQLATQVVDANLYTAVERALSLARILIENGPRRHFGPAESIESV